MASEGRDNSMDYDDLPQSEHLSLNYDSSHDCSMETVQPLFRVLTLEDVVNQMHAEINSVIETLQLPPTIVKLLLHHYKWDKQKLLEKYYCASEDAFFRGAHIINPHKDKAYAGHVKSTICKICYETTAVTTLECGHKFCDCCWSMYLTSRINNSSESTIPCPDSKCDIIIPDVEKFVTDPDIISKYNRLIHKNFVQCKKNLYWCPFPGCTYIIETLSDDCRYVTCLCNNQFCCGCNNEWHAPISCKLLKEWTKDDSVTQDYLSCNTKPCPKCEWSIEKNGGCPHMTCQNCKLEFCWKCLKPWLKHDGSYKCKSPEETQEIQKSRTLVERMRCCWDRYSYNRNALKEEHERYDMNWQEIDPHLSDLKDRVRILYECRRFLMHSYAFIFYLEEDNAVYILESNLDDLEAKTDKLTVSLEKLFLPEKDSDEHLPNINDCRIKIIDNAVHCDRLRKTWQIDIERKFEEDSWQYRNRFQE